MKTITVSIAGKEYVISPRCISENREWRKKLTCPIKVIYDIIGNADNIKLDKPEDIKPIIDLLVNSIAGSPDMILDLICDYSPEIANDRKHIEINGYDYEIVDVFKEVIKLVYPFGTLINSIRRRG